MEHYLQNIPKECANVGISKVLTVRHEMIHLKHIFTEVYHRETVNLDYWLSLLGMTHKDYMKYMTQRMRRLHKINREYRVDPNDITRFEYDRFFPLIELYKPFKTSIVLDFDGVVTRNKFKELYELCLGRSKTVICSANPEVNSARFDKLGLKHPDSIYANKGKFKKIKQLLKLNLEHDFIFYVDDEGLYLTAAWLFGIKTFWYQDAKIKPFSLNSK